MRAQVGKRWVVEGDVKDVAFFFSRRQKEKPTSRSTNSKNRKTKWVLLWKIDGRWMEGRIKKVEKDSNRGIEREREEKKRKKKATSTFLVDLL